VSSRVGVAGSGVGMRLHLPILEETGCIAIRTRIPHIASSTYETGASVSIDHSLDWLVVATPPMSHCALVKAALDCGVRVLCEKPVGLAAGTACELLSKYSLAADVLVNHQLRFDEPVRTWSRAIGEGDMIEFRYQSPARLALAAPAWYGCPKLGGGVLFSVGVHLIDLIHAVGRRFRSVRTKAADLPHLDAVDVEGVLHDGGLARLRIDGRTQKACFGLGVSNARTTSWLDFITGELSADISDHPPVDADGCQTLSSRAARPWRQAQRAFYQELFCAPDPAAASRQAAHLEDAIRTHSVIAACTDSLCRGGSWSSVEPWC
jgi:predicted dehydrogenase